MHFTIPIRGNSRRCLMKLNLMRCMQISNFLKLGELTKRVYFFEKNMQAKCIGAYTKNYSPQRPHRDIVPECAAFLRIPVQMERMRGKSSSTASYRLNIA